MQKGVNSLQNQLNFKLPAFYSVSNIFDFSDSYSVEAIPLEVYDFTFLHFHDFLEIGYCVSGSGVCCVDGIEYAFKSGDVQIIFPYQKHLSKSNGEDTSHWRWLNINPYTILTLAGFPDFRKLLELIRSKMAVCGIFSFEEYPVISKIAYDLLNKIINKSESYYRESFALKFYELILELAKISDNLPKLDIESKNSINSILPAVDAINNGIIDSRIPPISDLANLCAMSESNFRKIFQKLIGFSPKDYITKNQICNAERLLITTDKSILEISLCSGFSDISVFNRNFKSQTGMSPKEFRNKYGKKN